MAMNVMNHKTKILGALTVLLGFIQAYPGLSDMLAPQTYAWTMLVIGALVTVCGFLNSQEQTDANDQAG
jgi:hypothetical protein